MYIAAFSLPFAVYTLQWSTIYPALTNQLLYFYLFTFTVCLILGSLIQISVPFKYIQIKPSSNNSKVLFLLYLLYLIESLYSKQVPLLQIASGSFEYSEYSFGIPVLHTFLISFNTFYAIYTFHQYISSRRTHLILTFILAIFPFFLLVTRSSILHVLLGSFFVYLLSRPNLSIRIVLKSAIAILIVLFLFGMLGDIRSKSEDSSYIARISGGTEQFLNSSVPKQYYWSYLYIASPVANLQNNINFTSAPEGDYRSMIVNEFVPTFLTKFTFHTEERHFNQINPFLNVGTIYVYCFSDLRWKGMLMMFVYFVTIINLYYIFLIKSERYRVSGLAILCNIIVFANFHNTISYSVISLQLVYPIIFSMNRLVKNRHIQQFQKMD
ncbi:O-antigen polymerase [Mucilaginibacter ginkgonis]